MLPKRPRSRALYIHSYESVNAIRSIGHLAHTNDSIIAEYEEKAEPRWTGLADENVCDHAKGGWAVFLRLPSWPGQQDTGLRAALFSGVSSEPAGYASFRQLESAHEFCGGDRHVGVLGVFLAEPPPETRSECGASRRRFLLLLTESNTRESGK